MADHPADEVWTPEQVAEFRERLAEATGDPGCTILLPPAQAVLCDVSFIAQVRHLPDGAAEANHVRVRVTADHARRVGPSLETNLVNVVKSHLPPAEDGWHSPARCADE